MRKTKKMSKAAGCSLIAWMLFSCMTSETAR